MWGDLDLPAIATSANRPSARQQNFSASGKELDCASPAPPPFFEILRASTTRLGNRRLACPRLTSLSLPPLTSCTAFISSMSAFDEEKNDMVAPSAAARIEDDYAVDEQHALDFADENKGIDVVGGESLPMSIRA